MTKIHYKNATYAATLGEKKYVLYLHFSIRKTLVFITPIYYCWSEKPLLLKQVFSFYPQWPFWKSQVTNDIAWWPEISDQWKIGYISILPPLSRDLTKKGLIESPGKMTKFSFLYVEKKVHLAGLIFSQFLGNLSGSRKIQALFIFNNTMKKLHILIFIHTLL